MLLIVNGKLDFNKNLSATHRGLQPLVLCNVQIMTHWFSSQQNSSQWMDQCVYHHHPIKFNVDILFA